MTNVTLSNTMGEAQTQIRLKTKAKNEVKFHHIINYRQFKEEFGKKGETELQFLVKFYAARLLIEKGCSQIYVNPLIEAYQSSQVQREMKVDVCGIHNIGFILAFCETKQPTPELYKKLGFLASIKNVQIILLYPFTIPTNAILDHFPPEHQNKFSIEQVPWLDNDLEDSFQEALEFINLLCNETRVKMLLPLLKKTKRKGEYRAQINPKLVYENIANLMAHNLLHELSRNEYTLTPIGKQILGEYLAFIQRIKRTLKDFKR